MSIRRIKLGDSDGGDSEKNLGPVIRTINNTNNISIMREEPEAGALIMYLEAKTNASALLFRYRLSIYCAYTQHIRNSAFSIRGSLHFC